MTQFLHQIDDIFTEAECGALIAKADKNGWHTIDNGIANYDRSIITDDNMAKLLFDKIRYLLPITFKNQRIIGLNNHFRFSRYIPGGKFKIHKDGINVDDNGNRAVMTLNIFLNYVEDGGGTIFYKNSNGRRNIELNCRPKPGRGALFYNQIEHEGEIVKKGLKYLVRTDVMASIF